MSNHCLNITDEFLLNKLEYFIYNYSDIHKNIINKNKYIFKYFESNNYNEILKNNDKAKRYDLRKKISYYNSNVKLNEKDLKQVIKTFYEFLYTDNFEASICLNNLLDTIWNIGKESEKFECVKNLVGILASIYLIYFCSKAKKFNEKDTRILMKDIFKSRTKFYDDNDTKFLVRIFMKEEQFDCLSDLLLAKEYRYSIGKILYSIYRILFIYNLKGHYDKILMFFEKNENLIYENLNKVKKKDFEILKATALFKAKRYDEAKKILELYAVQIKSSSESNFFIFYNLALCYLISSYNTDVNLKHKEYIEKAYKWVEKAYNISKINKNKKISDDYIKKHIISLKSLILLEDEKYEDAYQCIQKAFFKGNEIISTHRIKGLFLSYYIKISVNYIHIKPKEKSNVLDSINRLYKNLKVDKWGHYEEILHFINNDVYLNTSDNRNQYYKIYGNLLDLFFYGLEILEEIKIQNISNYDILYYTKIENLKLLLEDETPNNSNYRLPLFHVLHMNDPEEGKILQKILKSKDESHLISENMYKENYVFLKSFFCYRKNEKGYSKKHYIEELLPMWVQYGDNAKGCCIMLNNKTFNIDSLYRVIYISNNGEVSNSKEYNVDKINELLKNFVSAYKNLSGIYKRIKAFECIKQMYERKECLKTFKNIVNSFISTISYLFKADSYKNENEIRLIKILTPKQINRIETVSSSVPKMYIHYSNQTYIDKIILGTKMENPEDYIPFIYKQGRKMWSDEKSQIEIIRSKIRYR